MRHSLVAVIVFVSVAVADEPVPKPAPAEPVTAAELDAATKKGVAFLLKAQNDDGSFGGPEKTKGLNIMASVPGSHQAFQTATTALSIAALIETGGDSAAVKSAIDKAESWLFERLPKLKRATPMELYNVWGHAYAIQALVRMHGRLPDDAARKAKIEELIRSQFEALTKYESVDGGWGYYDFRAGTQHPASDSTSFVNAAVLVAFHEAKAMGQEPPAKIVDRALAATRRQRKGDFTYFYGEYLKYQPLMPINRPGGSLGRSQACNVALRLWGDDKVTNEVMTTWLDRLIQRNGWLSNGRKRPIPHEAPFQVAGYFYYFGHYYAGLCVQQLPEKDRPFYQDHLARLLLPLQEPDGSWWDYPLYNYHQPYGTSFALLTLKDCRKK
ncbi:MAG: prenyltransferase/squalene oxidase repeat-containing protein [Gemmataceae bacterium]